MPSLGKRRCAELLCAYLVEEFNISMYSLEPRLKRSSVFCGSCDISKSMPDRVLAYQGNFIQMDLKAVKLLSMSNSSSFLM